MSKSTSNKINIVDIGKISMGYIFAVLFLTYLAWPCEFAAFFSTRKQVENKTTYTVDSVYGVEKSFVVCCIKTKPVSINISTVNGFSPGMAYIDSAYMMIDINGDTAYCDISYTYSPVKTHRITVRRMSGYINNDTTMRNVWMQVSDVREKHLSPNIHF